jgi:hypothetical protein
MGRSMNNLSAILRSFFARFTSERAKCEACRRADLKSNMRRKSTLEYVCENDDCEEVFNVENAWNQMR